MNNVTLFGNIARLGDLRYTQSGTGNISFSIAVDRPFTKGEDRKADFINCVAWGKTAEHIAQYYKKGNPILATGRIQVRSYEKDGATVWTTEVVIERTEFTQPKSSSESEDAHEVSFSENELPF